jgi:hypothetical protein
MPEAKDFSIRILAPVEITVDQAQGIKVLHGTPTRAEQIGSQGIERLVIPNIPHVFNVDELTVNDKDHNNEKIADVNVLMAHGIRSGDAWKFLDGQEVVPTVNAYNKYAGENGQKPVEFLVVCNEQEPDPMGIRIGEFDAFQNMAYAVGENVHLTGGDRSKVEQGKTVMDVSVESTFFGLDKLLDSKKMQSDIKIL